MDDLFCRRPEVIDKGFVRELDYKEGRKTDTLHLRRRHQLGDSVRQATCDCGRQEVPSDRGVADGTCESWVVGS
jgi:hypothetical protein